MFGAIIGDMVGSIYERKSCKSKKFDIYEPTMRMTDDSLLTIAVAKVLMRHFPIDYSSESLKCIQEDLAKEFVDAFFLKPHAGYGYLFTKWCIACKENNTIAPAYNSFGNGSAMRISPVAWITDSIEHLKLLTKTVTEITHNHPEGLKGAEAISLCIYLALHKKSKEEIKEIMIKDYYPMIANLDYDELVKNYKFNSSCQGSVPQAIYAFLISNSLEDAIRTCVAIGGDTDTIAAMAGSIAEAYYQKEQISPFEDRYLYFLIDPEVEKIIKDFHKTIGSGKNFHYFDCHFSVNAKI